MSNQLIALGLVSISGASIPREAALLGVPNAVLGLILYAVVAAALIAGWPTEWLVAGAAFAVAMSIYLAGYLIAKRLQCRICWVEHAANVALLVALLSM